jgi:cytochrome bd-type quinol oxidase subunit 1
MPAIRFSSRRAIRAEHRFHILFPSITIALAWILFYLRVRIEFGDDWCRPAQAVE